MKHFLWVTSVVASILLAAVPLSAQAQTYPVKPVHVVVPFAPGGPVDVLARVLSQDFGDAWGQAFVVENRAGAAGNIGVDLLAKAAPDGYTFGTVIAAHSVNPTLNPKLPYDTMKDFTYVSLTSVAPLILIAHPSVPAGNMKELIALAKAKPGTLNFASSGIGSAAHLTMEMLKSREGINLQHIPYKGTAGALQDLVGGQISVMFDVIGPLMSQVTPGNAKALAVTAKARVPAAANVATMTEQGVPDFVSGTWSMIIAPAGTPKEIVDRISLEAKKALSDPDLKKKLEDQGIVAMGSTPDEARAFVTEQIALWKKVIVEANIKLPE